MSSRSMLQVHVHVHSARRSARARCHFVYPVMLTRGHHEGQYDDIAKSTAQLFCTHAQACASREVACHREANDWCWNRIACTTDRLSSELRSCLCVSVNHRVDMHESPALHVKFNHATTTNWLLQFGGWTQNSRHLHLTDRSRSE